MRDTIENIVLAAVAIGSVLLVCAIPAIVVGSIIGVVLGLIYFFARLMGWVG